MAGTRSVLGYVQAQDDNAFTAEKPLSALQTLILRNNTQHLIDMSVQYRFNWTASVDEAGYAGGGDLDATRVQFCVVFPLTITDPDTMPSFDVRIATRCTGTLTSGTVQATISEINASQPIGTASGSAFKLFTVSTATETWHDWIVDVDTTWRGKQTSIAYQDVSLNGTETTTGTPLEFVMLKLLIVSRPTDATDGLLAICGVQIREYLSQ